MERQIAERAHKETKKTICLNPLVEKEGKKGSGGCFQSTEKIPLQTMRRRRERNHSSDEKKAPTSGEKTGRKRGHRARRNVPERNPNLERTATSVLHLMRKEEPNGLPALGKKKEEKRQGGEKGVTSLGPGGELQLLLTQKREKKKDSRSIAKKGKEKIHPKETLLARKKGKVSE